MDRNAKFLKRLTQKELDALSNVLEQIKRQDTNQLDIKKLRGHPDVFRVRVGTLRIIFRATRDVNEILEIARRSEKTYRDF